MTNIEATAPKRRTWRWGVFAVMLTLVAAFLIQLFGPNPRIIVSEDTTVITSPLRADGLPDYQKYWLELGREGATHENNGAVLFWQAIWPGELSQIDWQPMSDALGFEQIPDPTNTLQMPYGKVERSLLAYWLTQQYQAGLTAEESDVLLSPKNQQLIVNQVAEEVVDRAMSRPWTSEQVPPLAEWVTKNEKPLDLLIEASERPKWWSPSPSLLGNNYNGAIAMLLPGAQSMRGAARALCIRAMWHAGEGRPTEAWNDLKASFQLARFCSQGITLVEQLVAIAMDGIALQRTATLLQHGEPDAEFARQVLNNLKAMEVPCDVIKSMDQGERMFYADTVLMLSQQRMMLGDVWGPGGGGQFDKLALVKIDWNHLLREGNHWFDRLIDACKQPIRPERDAALDAFEQDLLQLGSATKNPSHWVASLLSPQARSAMLSDVLLSIMLPALDAAIKAEDRARMVLDLTRVAAALAVYRAEQGEYPEKLAELVPDVLERVPDDLYSGKPFIYERKSDGGYLLYSVFQNGLDDGGTDVGGEILKGEWIAKESEDFDYNKSDIVIRVPMPKFELPAKPEFVK